MTNASKFTQQSQTPTLCYSIVDILNVSHITIRFLPVCVYELSTYQSLKHSVPLPTHKQQRLSMVIIPSVY